MPRIHALLVGINEYTAVGALHGCVADITAVEALLRARIPADTLEMKVLRDAEATRAAIIDGFRTHLARATADDVALFYFCGHGSEEKCPPEWLLLEPSGRNQTILPVDARVGETFDLADKEMSALIHDVAKSGAQVVTLFDSCHSGGVTRNIDDDDEDSRAGVARMTAATKGRARTLADYLELAREMYDPARIADSGPPEPSHIAIAACQHDETAKEFPKHPTPRRGAFTLAFEEAVKALGPSATYTDLVTAIRTKVRDRAEDQLPNLSVTGSASGSTLFLAGHAGRRDLTITADAKGVWWLSMGAVDGMPTPSAGQLTEIAIYERGAFDAGGAAAQPIGQATVDQVLEDRASLRLAASAAPLDSAKSYIGTITRLSSLPLHVIVDGDDAIAVVTLREALGRSAVWYAVVESAGPAVPTVTVRVANGSATILDVAGMPMQNLAFKVHAVDATADAAARDQAARAMTASANAFVDACTHLGTWFGTRDRTPLASTLNGAVTIELVPAAAKEAGIPVDRPAHLATDGAVALKYSGAEPPWVQFRLRNTAAVRLYVALVNLTDSYGCSVMFEDWIPAGATAFAYAGAPKRLRIPDWRGPAVSSATDWLKVFASKGQFAGAQLKLASLLAPATREVDEEDDEPPTDSSFWGTTTLRVETRR